MSEVVVHLKDPMMVNHVECLNCGKTFYAPPEIATCTKCFSSVPGLHIKTEMALLPKGETAEWCEVEHEEPLHTLFISHSNYLERGFKNDVLMRQLDDTGFRRSKSEGSTVHIIPESAIDNVKCLIDQANEEHTFTLAAKFREWYGPTSFKLAVAIDGSGMDDVIDALEEVLNKIRDDHTSGHDRNECGNYNFNIEEISV